MKRVKFTRNTDPAREGGAYKEGQIVDLPDASARRWLNRSAAIDWTKGIHPDDAAAAKADAAEKKAAQENNDGNGVDGSADVGGQDGGGDGDGSESHEGAVQPRGRGRRAVHRDQRQRH